jgi:hypothetical protein
MKFGTSWLLRRWNQSVHEKTGPRLQEGQGSGKGGVDRLSLCRYIASIPASISGGGGGQDKNGTRF